jgi:hypothetical protein
VKVSMARGEEALSERRSLGLVHGAWLWGLAAGCGPRAANDVGEFFGLFEMFVAMLACLFIAVAMVAVLAVMFMAGASVMAGLAGAFSSSPVARAAASGVGAVVAAVGGAILLLWEPGTLAVWSGEPPPPPLKPWSLGHILMPSRIFGLFLVLSGLLNVLLAIGRVRLGRTS